MHQHQWQQTLHLLPHLAQTMTLLSLTAAELQQWIESELANNPALDLEEERRCPIVALVTPTGPCPACSQPKSKTPMNQLSLSPREDFYRWERKRHELPDEPYAQNRSTYPVTFCQAAADLQPEDRLLAAFSTTLMKTVF